MLENTDFATYIESKYKMAMGSIIDDSDDEWLMMILSKV
jgi:hypothetical protein